MLALLALCGCAPAAEGLIRAATGRATPPLFRFPYGSSDARTLSLVNRAGYGAIRWSVDTQGWRGTSAGQSADLAVSRVVAGIAPGEIVVMHVGAAPDGSTIDADALPRIIRELRSRGYGFVSLRLYLNGS
ncbi:MAG: polysaccharide deacetylase family protein [Candidatus Dormibacteria bacterium]